MIERDGTDLAWRDVGWPTDYEPELVETYRYTTVIQTSAGATRGAARRWRG